MFNLFNGLGNSQGIGTAGGGGGGGITPPPAPVGNRDPREQGAPVGNMMAPTAFGMNPYEQSPYSMGGKTGGGQPYQMGAKTGNGIPYGGPPGVVNDGGMGFGAAGGARDLGRDKTYWMP